MSRDVLPTAAHRWVMQQSEPLRVLDCTSLNQESESVQWLTAARVTMLGGSIRDCREPHLPQKLAATGYPHLLVRRDADDGQSLMDRSEPDGLHLAARFADSRVFEVTAQRPAIYTG